MSKSVLARGTGSSVVVQCCQVCGAQRLEPVVFLGYLPPVNQMRAIGETPREQPAYPAMLMRCAHCHLVQLGLTVDPAVLFPPEYPYSSGTTKILRDNFAQLREEVVEVLGLSPTDLIVDVGSNDGTLLESFRQHGQPVCGIEPSDMGKVAQQRGIPTIIDFFGAESARRCRAEHGPARVVTATNVFAHMEDVLTILDQIVELLDDQGVFISESHYLAGLIETLQYDTIYHEHLRYYSLHSLKFLLELRGLEVVRARRIPTHGGSIRVYAARRGKAPIDASVLRMLDEEVAAGLLDGAVYADFRRRVGRSKRDILALLREVKQHDASIVGIGAPSRASTLISYLAIDDSILDAVLEVKGSYKIGKYMPGTVIPVLDESLLFESQPDYALLLSWHIADELIPKLRARGYRGKFIVPLPEPRVVDV
ncbi:MAG: class I SAM-dependent methyltransferase [Pirellulales bacterium]